MHGIVAVEGHCAKRIDRHDVVRIDVSLALQHHDRRWPGVGKPFETRPAAGDAPLWLAGLMMHCRIEVVTAWEWLPTRRRVGVVSTFANVLCKAITLSMWHLRFILELQKWSCAHVRYFP